MSEFYNTNEKVINFTIAVARIVSIYADTHMHNHRNGYCAQAICNLRHFRQLLLQFCIWFGDNDIYPGIIA